VARRQLGEHGVDLRLELGGDEGGGLLLGRPRGGLAGALEATADEAGGGGDVGGEGGAGGGDGLFVPDGEVGVEGGLLPGGLLVPAIAAPRSRRPGHSVKGGLPSTRK